MTLPDRSTAPFNDRYRIERELGRGGMATVLLAVDLKHDRPVAIKILRPELSSSLASERFLREIALAAKLSHPNILPLYDSGEWDGALFYVMPYVQGESLRDRLDREGALNTEEAIAIVREVADALSHAHAAGVIHRDIKPENILLSSGHAVVSDFGIARAVDVAGGERLTASGLAIGTPAYMSPEQASGEHEVDARSDIYSLACVAYEMLGGDPPFTGASPQAIMARHAVDTPLPLRSVRPTVPEAVDVVLEKALAKVPADRFATAIQLADALAVAQKTGDVSPLWSPLLWVRRRSTRITRVVAVVAVAGLVAIGARGLINASAASITSIAVLPFDNLSGDSTDEYFTAGMRDALRGALGQVGALHVLSGSTDRYRNSPKPDTAIARELDVDALVRASVVRSGDSVHVQIRMIQARPSERLLWSQNYDREVRGVLAMHNDAARGIAKAASAELTESQDAGLARPRPVNAESYEAYLRGMYYLNQVTSADARRGLTYFQNAVEKNPGDPLAYAGLAHAYATIAHSPVPLVDDLAYGRAAALRAIALDSMLAEGWAALAEIKVYREWDWAGAERAFRRAIELNPNLAWTHYHYAWYLALFDRMDEAIAEHKRAQALDPFTPQHTVHLGSLYAMAGRYDDAIVEGRKALTMGGRGLAVRHLLGRAYTEKGMHDAAVAQADSTAALSPEQTHYMGRVYARAGRMDRTRRLLADAERLPTTPIRALNRALLNALVGNNDEFFRWINYEPHHAFVPWIRVVPEWTTPSIRRDPRFQQTLRRMNLPMPDPRVLAAR